VNRRRFLAAAVSLAALPGLAAAARFDRGVLWRLTKKGAPASHVYGTVHVADPRLETLPDAVERAFEASRALVLEFLPDPYAQERFAEAALFLDGQTLEQKIGAADFERVLERLQPIGLPREFVRKMKPWGVLVNLRGAGAAEGAPHEARLAERARRRRMPTSQMEGVEEQIFTFDEMPMESQVALLRHSLAYGEELAELAARTLEAYLARDVAGIWQLREAFIARHPQVAAHQAVLTKRVLYDRSVVMAFRMQREMRRGGAFVALGALHLHGGKGVLALLEEDGYRAARVY
jgi:uncharacterized protein